MKRGLGILVVVVLASRLGAADSVDYQKLHADLLVEYQKLAVLYNRDATKLRHLEREYQVYKDQLAGTAVGTTFDEALRTSILLRFYGARHYEIAPPGGFPNAREVYDRFRSTPDFPSFLTWTDGRFEQVKARLVESWGIKDPDTVRTFYCTWLVSNLWGQGRNEGYNPGGCALQTDGAEPRNLGPDEVTYASYQNSAGGCCSDFSIFLKMFLDAAKISNRVVYVKGHVTNEVFLQGKWWMVDAMTGLAIDISRQEIIDRQNYPGAGLENFTTGLLNIYWLPHPGMEQTHPAYRPVTGAYRLYYLLETLRGKMPIELVLNGTDAYDILPYGEALKGFQLPGR